MTVPAAAATAGVILFPLAMVYAGLMDLFTMKIRNTLVIAIAVGWIILAPLAGFGMAEMGWSAAVALLVFVVSFTFFAMGWIGGGDAKLAAVTALWFDPQNALTYYVVASFLGGLLTLAILQFRTRLMPEAVLRYGWLSTLHDRKSGIPYGAAMAPAALLIFPETAWIAHAAF